MRLGSLLVFSLLLVVFIQPLTTTGGVHAESLTSDSPVTNSIGMKLKRIKRGSFPMGNPVKEEMGLDYPEHRVRISGDFWLGVTEVTQGQWEAVMGTHPWKDQEHVKAGANYPATFVSWEDAVRFCKRLSVKEGVVYRLPTEAEWEFACRAGTTITDYSFGDGTTALEDHVWFFANTHKVNEKYAHQVGTKRPNPWGLYNMHGNVCEWCQDWYGGYESAAAVDPVGSPTGSEKVVRGGSWYYDASNCRSSSRNYITPSHRSRYLGFRVAR